MQIGSGGLDLIQYSAKRLILNSTVTLKDVTFLSQSTDYAPLNTQTHARNWPL